MYNVHLYFSLKNLSKKVSIIHGKKRYLEINLIKEVKDIYTENYNTFFKKLKNTQINGKILNVY